MPASQSTWRGWDITTTTETGRVECVKPQESEPSGRLVVIAANRNDLDRALSVAKRDMLLEEARVAGGGIQRDRQGNPKKNADGSMVIDYDPDLYDLAMAQHAAIRSGAPDVE
jgi:hypothetical protein